ncbi:helix-turn-helix domain-containing protein [Aeromicrobium sp. Root495]|uniref:helix-turn-helix domain-containing protein n=1 Tax=Aeromicrobium sp. Root495 TaxID=1736550 RepID=UPI0012E72275|nr:helix-turn-helix domain-containing protein [Aeromicrobium sp. Root495]
MPERVAALIEARTNISQLRVQLRGVDPEASQVLEAIRLLAMSWDPASRFPGSETGDDADRKPASESRWMTSGQVAKGLGITPQAVGKAIRAGRLRAQQNDGGRYVIDRQDYEHFRAARAA